MTKCRSIRIVTKDAYAPFSSTAQALGHHRYEGYQPCTDLVVSVAGQNQSGSGGAGGDKRDDKDKKKKYEPPIPTRVGKKKRRTKGPDAAMKLPQAAGFSVISVYFRGVCACLFSIASTTGKFGDAGDRL
uniref:Uncharacterized protein n=1 Tax=Timema douglasi TaxID=61478 RepID=A0A7R8ZB69_TIMDO|nr:unnamed protein product [Timema douglasi]